MSLSRSPSPHPNGGWYSRGLTDEIIPPPNKPNGYANNDGQWAAARVKSKKVRDMPSIQTKNEGFFQRSKRKISATLPTFNKHGPKTPYDWREAEKLGRGRWYPRGGGALSRLRTLVGNVLRKFRFLFIILSVVIMVTVIVSKSGVKQRYRASESGGGGSKFVIILAANEGGGVMDWKGPREWAIERDSVKNKKKYAERWGYHLEIADMSTKKKYAHEWRESWEKVDIMRHTMNRYPKAEWFWWLDLNTYIMELSVSLQQHLFNDLSAKTYRDINHYNPLNITHPPPSELLDPISASATSDNKSSSIDVIISQDCGGFNLGSFFMRRSAFSDRLIDLWWDPVLYEQKHMEWEHKEQDALEHLYASQPYLRTHIAFVEQRLINSFPPGACSVKDENGEEQKDVLDPRIHYNEKDRDFMVNMAGCEWGRDCWGEMYHYRELSYALNKGKWESFVDGCRAAWKNFKKDWFEGGEQNPQT